MEHKIVAFNAETGSATVKFWTEAYPSGLLLNVDIPVENGAYISGEALNSLIQSFAPVGQIARLVALRDNPPSAAGIVVDPDPLPSAELPPDPILDATLPDAIKYAETAVDRSAGAARARFISTGPGQDGVYMGKGQQAETFAAAGFTGPAPSYVAKEAEMLGVTPRAAAESMLQTRDIWINQIDPLIEGTRISGKKRVREAATVQQVDQILREVNLTLQAIHP